MAYILHIYGKIQGIHPTFYISLLQLYSARGATLGLLDSIVTASEEEENEVKSILRHRQGGCVIECLLHWCGYDEERIVGSQRKISFMLNRFYNSISVLTGFSEIVH